MSDFDYSAHLDDTYVPEDYNAGDDFDYSADEDQYEETVIEETVIPSEDEIDDVVKQNTVPDTFTPAFLKGRLWKAEDYRGVTGEGAEKLASSAIAPLVAFARGYADVTKDNFAAVATQHSFKAVGQGQPARLKREAADSREGDPGMMIMPWFSGEIIANADRVGKVAKSTIGQFRPARPEIIDDKPLKYEGPKGGSLPRDLHPGVHADWINDTTDVVFAEGLLKGDSALSAYLLANGASIDEMRVDDDMTVEQARAEIRAILDAIPEEKRVVILTVSSVTTTKASPKEWMGMNFKGRRGIIAFDADVTSNVEVYRHASRFWNAIEATGMKPMLLSPKITSGDAGEYAKIGVDDYLADHGTWDDLWAKVTDALPERPWGKEEVEVGTLRVDPDGASVSMAQATTDSQGRQTGIYWDEVCAIGARVIGVRHERYPNATELQTGTFGVGVSHKIQATVEIEVKFRDKGVIQTHTVVGPAKMVAHSPAEWTKMDAFIPAEVLLHDHWPPKQGMEWMSAVKRFRADERSAKTAWKRIGWVPTLGQFPIYLTPSSILADPGTDPYKTNECWVTEEELEGANNFGVGENAEGDFNDPQYRDEVRRAFEKTIEMFIDKGVWTRSENAAAVLAGAFRPAIPLPIRTPMYLSGSAGSGKSWSAGVMMAPHAARPGCFSRVLPGSAKDTELAIQMAVARTPIWVVDDVAPSNNARQSELEASKAGNIGRAAVNGSTKRRSNSQMGTAETHSPYALTVVTGENELTIASERGRYINLTFGPGSLNKDSSIVDEMMEFRRSGVEAPALNAGLINYIRWCANNHEGGWAGYYKELEELKVGLAKKTEHLMEKQGAKKSTTARPAELASDLLLTLEVMRNLAQELKMDKEFVAQFHITGLGRKIVKLVTDSHATNSERTPGMSLLEALKSVLAGGIAHVVSVDDTGTAPIKGDEDSDQDSGNSSTFLNTRLGWKADPTGVMRPQGESIGVVVNHPKTGERVILFDATIAFRVAQKHYPVLLPSGQNGDASWPAIWNEGIAFDGWDRQPSTSGALLSTIQIKSKGFRPRGVPVLLDTVINGSIDNGDDSVDE